MPRRRVSCALVVLVALAAAAPLPAAASSGDLAAGDVVAHYVLYGQAPATKETVPIARLIAALGTVCPEVTGGGSTVQMLPRSNPHGFPVVVCEAPIGFGDDWAIQLADGPLSLPKIARNPAKIIALGDTGCQPWKEKDLVARCPQGSPAVPFQNLADKAAGESPDLVLHMGDANYRGTSVDVHFTLPGASGKPEQQKMYTYDAGDGSVAGQHCTQGSTPYLSQNAPNANYPDSWEVWRDDFFVPAAELLRAAPWIVARGNHELCSRAGPGWFYFLDTSSDYVAGGKQLHCPVPQPEKTPIHNVVLSPPFAVDLGTLTVLVLDSANACDSFTQKDFVAAYAKQLATIAELAPASGTAWMISHRPFWGVTDFESRDGQPESTGCTPEKTYGCVNRTLQAALAAGQTALPASLELLVAGHMHKFQALTFEGDRPPIVVIGTGGVSLDPSDPVGSFSTVVDGLTAKGLGTGAALVDQGSLVPAYGYLEIDYSADGTWTGKLRSPELDWGACGSAMAQAGAVCAFADGVTAYGAGE